MHKREENNNLKILVCGRPGSGKTTAINEFKNRFSADYVEIFDCSLTNIANLYQENCKIMLIDTPAILCIQRKKYSEDKVTKDDTYLDHIRDIAHFTFDNSKTIEDLIVKFKKIINKL